MVLARIKYLLLYLIECMYAYMYVSCMHMFVNGKGKSGVGMGTFLGMGEKGVWNKRELGGFLFHAN